MEDHNLVSVFMPCYNQEDFIRDAIESVVQQDYPDLELIIGDDCSTDKTWEIVCHYKALYPNLIKAFRNQTNLGITANCNKVLEKCSGKYICFTSGDDSYLPGKISKQVDFMKLNQNLILSYHDIEVYSSADDKTIRYWNHGKSSKRAITGSSAIVADKILQEGTSFIASLSVMAKAENIPASGYDMRVPVASDWLMWIEILMSGRDDAEVGFLPDVLARYRMHNNNISGTGYKHTADEYVTLSIVEDKYPEFANSVNRGLAQVRYRYGARYIRAGRRKVGRQLMLLSLRNRWLSWKVFYWIAASYCTALPTQRKKIFKRLL
jgi:glycosyltransferase involved in cell wall biosynthesis